MGIRSEGFDPRFLMADNSLHTPVMLERTLELLPPRSERPGAVLVDATLGLGGHAEAFLERFPELESRRPRPRPRRAARSRGSGSPRSATASTSCTPSTTSIAEALDELGIAAVAGILFDLGVSSMQLDQVERGFSYSKDAPLDMRMDDTGELTAARILAEYDEASLRRIFYEYGEEKLAPRYAQPHRARARAIAPLVRSAQLVDVLIAATPAARPARGHPAKRVFQALRIEVNQELAVLERAIPGRPRRARGRRADRRAGVPVARRPHRQARTCGAIHARPPRAAFRSNCPSTAPS